MTSFICQKDDITSRQGGGPKMEKQKTCRKRKGKCTMDYERERKIERETETEREGER